MRSTWVALFIIFALGGCARDGRPKLSYPVVDTQYKLKSAAHWNVVASDVARQLCSRSSGLPIYVPKLSVDTTFSRVFSSQLKSGLQDSGCVLASSTSNAVDVSVSVDEVRHATLSDRRFAPGELTLLASGVLVLRDMATPVTNAVDFYALSLIALDGYSFIKDLSNPPGTEIVLSISARRNDEVVMHKTNIYYIEELDAELFSLGRRFKVVGSKND